MIEEGSESYGCGINLYSILGGSNDVYEGFKESLGNFQSSVDALRKSNTLGRVADAESSSLSSYEEFERLAKIFGRVPEPLAADYLKISRDCLDLLAEVGAEREYESVADREWLIKLIQTEWAYS